jgi:hypothetical protein
MKASEARKNLDFILFNSADLSLKTQAGFGSFNQPLEYKKSKLATLGQPFLIDDFIGDDVRAINAAATQIAEKADQYKADIVLFRNTLQSRLDSIRSQNTQLAEKINNYSISNPNPETQVYWVSDSFNTGSYIDQKQSSVFLDSDYGYIELPVDSLVPVGGITVKLDSPTMRASKTIPGCNLLAIDYTPGSATEPPQGVFESSPVLSLANPFDNDPQTWFEVERVFVLPQQRVVNRSKGFFADNNGSVVDVKEVTQDLDWKAYIDWGDGSVDEGPNQQGVRVVEFIDPQKLDESTTVSTSQNSDSKLHITLTLGKPQPISYLRVGFGLRDPSAPLVIDEVWAQVSGLTDPIFLGKDIKVAVGDQVESSTTATQIAQPQPRNASITLPFPTTRNVEKVTLVARSGIGALTKILHPYLWANVHRRSVRNYGFFKSVDHEDIPKRLPVFEKIPTIRVSSSPNNNWGSMGTLDRESSVSEGQVIDSENKQGPIAGLGAAADAFFNVRPGSKDALIYNGITSVFGDLFNIGGFSRDFTVTDVEQGVDVFHAFRSGIILTGMSLDERNYKPKGELRSIVRKFAKPVSAVSLFVDYEIPSNWESSDWVTFMVSFDRGQTWTSIVPNSILKLPVPSDEVIFRALIKGNSADKTLSPKILHYAIKGIQA